MHIQFSNIVSALLKKKCLEVSDGWILILVKVAIVNGNHDENTATVNWE